jgi:hypothetical protein
MLKQTIQSCWRTFSIRFHRIDGFNSKARCAVMPLYSAD